MQTKKTPTKLGSMAGDLTKHLDRHCTAHQQKNVQVHHHAGAILATKAKAPVLQNTFLLTGQTAPKVRFCHARIPSGFGADGPFREAGRTALTSVLNICPPTLQNVGEPKDSLTEHDMANSQSTNTPIQGNTTDHHQTDLFFQASNHLAIALHSLRHATGDQGIKTAAGRANAAARALNQLAGGLSNV